MRFLLRQKLLCALLMLLIGATIFSFSSGISSASQQNPQEGSVGLQGKISAPPPTQGATITFPTNGSNFNNLPITVTGICPKGTLVKLFKNNVFAGSVDCVNGSYSILIDLFNGTNELIARVFDSLDQQGPDSNKVTVTYNNAKDGIGIRVSITTNYAKRGAPPGSTLTWPVTISGGSGPYAVSIDWGDKKPAQLLSRPFPGEFNLEHVYDAAGVYNIIVKVTDRDGNSAFLQVVGIGNGPIPQTNTSGTTKDQPTTTIKTFIWWPLAILIPLVITTFWLGRHHQLHLIRKKLERGDRPF